MGSGGGAARTGCAAFSLVGILVAVGVTVWLSSQVFDATGGSPGRDRTPVPTTAATTVVPRPTTPPTPATATPIDGLVDGQRVTVASDGFAPGTAVQVVPCYADRAGLAKGFPQLDPCGDPLGEAVVDAAGRLRVDVAVAAELDLDLVPWDCTEAPGTCTLEVVGADGSRSVALPLTFA